MDNDIKDIFSVQGTIDDGTIQTIAFDYLWLLYKPGDIVLSRSEQKRAYVVLHVTGGRALRSARAPTSRGRSIDDYYSRDLDEGYLASNLKTTPFLLDCFYIDFDGTSYGPLPQRFELSEYQGEKSIHTLEVFPAKFAAKPQQMEKALIKRGKRFVRYARVDHKYYSGKTVKEPWSLEVPGEVHGEIIIDFALALKAFRGGTHTRGLHGYRHDSRLGTSGIGKPTPVDERERRDCLETLPESRRVWVMRDSILDNELTYDYMEKTSLLKQRPSNETLPNEVLKLLPPRVFGFSLLDRGWYAFDVGKIEDVKKSDQGFDNLVIPKEHKKIMQALVQHGSRGTGAPSTHEGGANGDFTMDVVRGKAAQTKRPLLPITCGDIGTTQEEVEKNLNEYFDMAWKWGCVLLLDEADVFLAQREKGGDLERNGVVSVFLRVLEYYSGILILTTNRVGEFDEAFISRVHIKLYYPELDEKSTLEIWKMNMRRITESGLDMTVKEAEIKKFPRKLWVNGKNKPSHRWNGRQIRNAFQTAIALAKWDHQEDNDGEERPVLSVRQFKVVSNTSSIFDTYVSNMLSIPETSHNLGTVMAREQTRGKDASQEPTDRATGVMQTMQARKKIETFEEEEDEDQSDSDKNNEDLKSQIKTLTEKLGKLQRLADNDPRDVPSSQMAQKARPQAVKEGEDSSSSSDEAE